MFDAIVTDPPYGVREGIKKIGRKPNKRKKDVIVDPTAPGFIHVPMRTVYPYRELLEDIVMFGVRNLRPGGRLVAGGFVECAIIIIIKIIKNFVR